MKSTKTPSLAEAPIEIRITKNSDGTYRIIVNGATVVPSVAYKDLASALARRFGWGSSKKLETGLGAAPNERPSAGGSVKVERDYRGGGWLVERVLGREKKAYRFNDEARARQFASELAAGRYPSSATTSLQAANEGGECFLIEGPTIPLRRMFSPDGH